MGFWMGFLAGAVSLWALSCLAGVALACILSRGDGRRRDEDAP